MAHVPNGYDVFLDQGYLDVEDKLKECRFFLNLHEGHSRMGSVLMADQCILKRSAVCNRLLALSADYAIPGDAQWEMESDERAISVLNKYFKINPQKATSNVFASPLHPLLKELSHHRTGPHTRDDCG